MTSTMSDYTYQVSKDGKKWRNISFLSMKKRIWKQYEGTPLAPVIITQIMAGKSVTVDDGTQYRRVSENEKG